jgi:hypothetical protein
MVCAIAIIRRMRLGHELLVNTSHWERKAVNQNDSANTIEELVTGCDNTEA